MLEKSYTASDSIKSFALTRFPLHVEALMPTHLIHLAKMGTSIEEHVDYLTRTLVLRLRAYLVKNTHTQQEVTHFRFPATPWDFFKKEYFPLWLLQKFPASYKNYPFEYERNINICPHANIEWPGDEHLRFLKFDL